MEVIGDLSQGHSGKGRGRGEVRSGEKVRDRHGLQVWP